MNAVARTAPPKAAPRWAPAVTARGHACERQARAAAHAALAGVQDLGRTLTPSPAAPARVLVDTGRPLAAPLRARAERAFGADLSAVRVHTGAEAAALTAAHRAEALTAGRDIAFAPGRFDPSSVEGWERLLHEIAHVLQQTGRAASDGRLAATPASGAGPLQRDNLPGAQTLPSSADAEAMIGFERDKVLKALKEAHGKLHASVETQGESVWTGMTFKDLVDGHRPSGADASYGALTSALAKELGFAETEDAGWGLSTWPTPVGEDFDKNAAAIAAFPTDTRFTSVFGEDGAGYGLLYDVYKKLEMYGAAVDLLGVAPRLKTLHWRGKMRWAVDSGAGQDNAKALLAPKSEVQKLVEAMDRRVNQLAFVPALGLEPLKADLDGDLKPLTEWARTLVLRVIDKTKTLTPNEMVFGVYLGVMQADSELEAGLKKELQDPKATMPGRADAMARYRINRAMIIAGSALARLSGDDHGYLAMVGQGPIGEAMEAAGRRGMPFWRQVVQQDKLSFGEDPAVRADAIGKAVHESLAKQAKTFFALADGPEEELPEPAAYEGRVGVWSRALKGDLTSVEFALLKRLAALDSKSLKAGWGREAEIGRDHLMEFYGALVSGLTTGLSARLGQYDAGQDRTATQILKIEDVRGAHRISVAASLYQIARAVGWGDLRAQADDWLMSRDRRGSHIYLLSEWERSSAADSNLSNLPKEVGGVVQNWPISGPGLNLVFQIMETQLRADTLSRLQAAQPAPGGDGRPMHREVDRAIGDLPRPQRWEIKKYVFALDKSFEAAAEAKGKADMEAAKAEEAAQEGQAAPAPTTAPQDEAATTEAPKASPGLRLAELLANHPKTLQLFHELKSEHPDVGLAMPAYDQLRGTIRPYAIEGFLPVFAWQVPSLDAVVTVVRRSNVANQRVLNTIAAQEKAPDGSPKVPLDAASEAGKALLDTKTNPQWVDLFFEGLVNQKLDSVTALGEEVDLSGELTEERKRYRALLRQAAVRDRRAMVARHQAALADKELTVRVFAPDNALKDLQGVVTQMFPAAQIGLDRVAELQPPLGPLADVHQALAVLQLAPDIKPGIEAALGNYDTALIAGYLALLPKAMKVADDVLVEAGNSLVERALGEGESLAEALKNRPLLNELLLSLERQRIDYQVSMGIRGECHQEKSDYTAFKEKHPDIEKLHKARPELRTLVRFFALDEPNPAFVNGITHGVPLTPGMEFGDWTLLDVINPFTYVPSFVGDASRSPDHPGFRKGWVFTGYRQASEVQELGKKTLGGGGDAAIAGELYPPDAVLLKLQAGANEPIFVKAGDIALLDSLTNPINIGSIVAGLEMSAEAIAFMMDLITDVVATLFGGLGEAGKISAELLAITTSEEFQTLVENFQKDPTKLITEVIDTVKDKVLEPSFFLKYLLFPTTGPIDYLFKLAKGDGAPRKPKPTKKRTPFGEVINAILNLGKHVAAAFERVHERFEGPVGALRSGVVTRPRLRWALELVAKYGPMILTVVQIVKQAIDEHPDLANQVAALVTGEGSKPTPKVEADTGEDAKAARRSEEHDRQKARDADAPPPEGGTLRQLFAGMMAEKVKALDESLAKTLATLSEIELPSEVVKLEALVKAILTLVLQLASKSAKGKIANIILHRSGAVEIYSEEVAQQIRSAGLDPNRVWSHYFLPELGPKFTEFRDLAVDGLYEVVDNTLQKLQSGLSVVGGEEVKLQQFKFPPDKKEKITVTPAEGDYSAALRDPDAMLSLWRGGVTLPASPGQPMDDALRASAESRFGHDFRHVRIHAGREGEEAASPAGALALTSGSHIYLSPKVTPTSNSGREVIDHELAHVLQQTGARPLGEPHSGHPRRGIARKGLVVDRDNETEAEETVKAVRQRDAETPIPVSRRDEDETIAPKFDPAVAFEVLELFTRYRDIQEFAAGIDKTPPPKTKDPMDAMVVALWREALATPLADPKKGYDPTFRDQQPNILSLLSGHSKAVEKALPTLLRKSWKAIPGKKKKGYAKPEPDKHEFKPWAFAGALTAYLFATTGVVVRFDIDTKTGDATKGDLKGAKVTYLNLGKVPLDHPLWTELPFKNAFGPELRRELAVRMAVLDPAPGVWKPSAYELEGVFLGDMSERSKKRPTAKVPNKTSYLQVDSKDREGLRFGSHGALTTAPNGAFGKNRESHHTTQFLLAQYFHNARDKQKPFRKGVAYPGVSRVGGSKTSGRVETISGAKDIKVKDTFGEGGRGDPMPAILIAAETHRQGRLHVAREGKWLSEEEQGGSFTQGYAIDNIFRAALPEWMGRLEAKSTEALKTQIGKHTPDEVRGGIYKAAQDTYAWMYQSTMRKALIDALPRNELAYYRGLAAKDEANFADKGKGVLKAAYDLKESEMDHIGAEAAKRNLSAMAAFGWVL